MLKNKQLIDSLSEKIGTYFDFTPDSFKQIIVDGICTAIIHQRKFLNPTAPRTYLFALAELEKNIFSKHEELLFDDETAAFMNECSERYIAKYRVELAVRAN